MTKHKIGTREEWLAARVELLQREKEHGRRSDELARRRRELPWVRIEKDYSFETDEGTKSLAQLLVYHFMFGYGLRVNDETEGCSACSFVADHLDATLPHLGARDVTLVCASIAPLERLQAYKERMGWTFSWVSSLGSDFSYDFGVAFSEEQQRDGAEYNFRHVAAPGEQEPGLSAFAIDGGVVHHTYSTYARGVEALMGTYPILDLAPRGRDEDNLETSGPWWRRHDEYGLP